MTDYGLFSKSLLPPNLTLFQWYIDILMSQTQILDMVYSFIFIYLFIYSFFSIEFSISYFL